MSSTQRQRVTLNSIAEATGLSKGTVSKALSGRSDVSESTRTRVKEMARDLGYFSRALAPAPIVAVVADSFESIYTMLVLRGIAAECNRRHYMMNATYIDNAASADSMMPLSPEWFDLIAALPCRGLIVLTRRIDQDVMDSCERLNVPLVTIDPLHTQPPDTYSVGATNWNGALDATQHLIELGHRHIGFIGGPAESIPSVERQQGFQSALLLNDLSVNPQWIVTREFTFEFGFEAALSILSNPGPRPTAFVAASDLLALGAIAAARQLNMRIPEDISVVGFDDTVIASASSPPLTTIHQPLTAMGEAAVRILADIEVGIRPTGPMKLNTTLIVRQSTAPPTE